MNSDYNQIHAHSKELYELGNLVSPSTTVSIFRKIWYGITHFTGWMNDDKIRAKIADEVKNLTTVITQATSSYEDAGELHNFPLFNSMKKEIDFAEKALKCARKAVDHLGKTPTYIKDFSDLKTSCKEWKIAKRIALLSPLHKTPPLHTKANDPTRTTQIARYDETMLAHVLGGFMIKEIEELEGSTHVETMQYVLNFIDIFLSEPSATKHEISLEKILKLKQELKQGLEYATEIQKLKLRTFEKGSHQEKQLLVRKILDQLKNLQKGQAFLQSGGWSGSSGLPGHAMLYRFEKNEQGLINLSIINTGSGVETHDYMVEGTKQKFNPVRQFNNLQCVDREIDERLITAIVEKQLLPYEEKQVKFDWKDVYGIEVERLSAKEVFLPPEKQDMITGQRSGVCAYKSVLIEARIILGVKSYKVFKQQLELQALIDGSQKLTNGGYQGKNEHHVISILERASKRMMRATVKLRKDRLLNKEDARKAYDIAQQTVVAVATYSKKDFIPYHPSIEKIYSPSASKAAIKSLHRKNYLVPQSKPSKPDFNFIPGIVTTKDPRIFVEEMELLLPLLKKERSFIWQGVKTTNMLIFNILNKINYAKNPELWDKIAADPVLLEKAFFALEKLTLILENGSGLFERRFASVNKNSMIMPFEVAAILNIYTTISFLGQRVWSRSSTLKEFGPNGNLFKDFQKQWRCKDLFDPAFEKNLETLENLNGTKIQLFKNIEFPGLNNVFKFNDPEDFKKVADWRFLEALLIENPDLEKSINLTSDQTLEMMQTPLGKESKENRIRYKALLLYLKKIESKNLEYLSYALLQKLKNLYNTLWENKNANFFKIKRLPNSWKISFVKYSQNGGPIGLRSYKKQQHLLSENLPTKQVVFDSEQNPHLNPQLFSEDNYSITQNANLVDCYYAGNHSEDERELRDLGSAKEVQIDHLLEIFELHPDWIKEPQNQLYFRSRLLEGNLLLEHLNSEPLLATHLLRYLNFAFKKTLESRNPSSVEVVNLQLYLTQLSAKILQYLRMQKIVNPSLVIENMKTFEDLEQKLHLLNSEQRRFLVQQKASIQEPWLQSYLEYTLLFSNPYLQKESLTFEEARDVIMNVARARKNAMKGSKEMKSYVDTHIILAGMYAVQDQWHLLKNGCEKNAHALCQELLELYNYPSVQWEGNFPLYSGLDQEKNNYKVNLLTGLLLINNREKRSFPKEAKHISLYKQLFGSKSNDVKWISFGSHFYTYHQGVRINAIFSSKNDLDYQFVIEVGEYSYSFQKADKVSSFALPTALTEKKLIWLALSKDNPQAKCLIFDSEMKQKIAEVHSSGEIICTATEENLLNYKFIELANHPLFKGMASFRRKSAEAWGEKNEVKHIVYRDLIDDAGQFLSFSSDQTGKMVWNKNPKYSIASNQAVHVLRGAEEHLLLSGSDGTQMVVIPQKNSKEKSSYLCVPLSKAGELIPSDCLQKLQISEVLFKKGDYARSMFYLFQAQEPRPYTLEERTVARRIIESKGRDPWASLTRVYTAVQFLDNIALTPPSQSKLEKDEKSFWNKGVLDIVIEEYTNYVTNRNVPLRYQPTQILGIDRELRLFKKINNYLRSKNKSFSNKLNEYLWEITQKKYSPLQGKTHKGSSVPKSKKNVDLIDIRGFDSNVKSDEHLMRPGKVFQKNFTHYYAQAISDNSADREDLVDRLAFMQFDTNSENLRLVSLLLKIVDVKDSKAGLKGFFRKAQTFNIDIPSLSGKTSYQIKEDFELFIKDYTQAVGFSREEKQTNFNFLVFPSISEAEKSTFLKPSFASVILPSFLSKDISQHITKGIITTLAMPLYTETQLDELNKRLDLPVYVKNKLQILNDTVSIQDEPSTAIYTLKEDVPVDDLKTELDQTISRNIVHLDLVKQKILEISNKKTGFHKRDLELDLLRGSEKQEAWTLEKCLATFLHERWDLYQLQDPALTLEEIDTLHQLIVEFLVISIRTRKAEHGIELLEELAAVSGNKAAENKVRIELGSLLMVQETYDYNNNPALLLFEYASGWTISAAQSQMLKELFTIDAKDGYRHMILQLIMGGGKSTVISPIQAQMKADGKHLSLLVVPDALFETNRNDTSFKSRNLFGQTVRSLEFSREDNTVKYLETLRYTLHEAITHREYLITRPKDLLCLELEHWESRAELSRLSKGQEDEQQWKEKAQLLKEILQLLSEYGCATFDEADTIFKSKYHVNFTLGEALSPSVDTIETISDIYRHLLTHPKLYPIVRLCHNRQSLLTNSEWIHVKTILLDELTQKISNEYSLPFSKEQLRNYCEGKDTQENREVYATLKKLYSQKDPKIMRGIRKLAVLKLEMESLLKETLKKNSDTHHGLSKENPQIGIAIPYVANNTPSERAQFADSYETMNKTFQTISTGWKEPAQTILFIQHFRDRVHDLRDMNEEIEVKALLDQFKAATGFHLFSEAGISEEELINNLTVTLDKKLKHSDPHVASLDLIFDFVKHVPLGKQLTVYQKQLSANTQDLDGIVKSSQGYTGTTGPKNAFPVRIQCLPNPETDREISRTLIEEKAPISIVTEETPSDVLNSLFKNRTDISSFQAFIDAGTLFKGKSNLQVAESMLSFFETNKHTIRAIVFWDDKTNIPTLLYRQNGTLRKYILEGTSRETVEGICKKLQMDPAHLFTYYDERHIVGTDLYYAPEKRAFLTCSSQTSKDKLFQAVMRMRQVVKREHHIELVIHEEEEKRISNSVQGNIATSLSIENIIIHSELIQSLQEVQENLDATKQMMLKVVKQFFRNKILQASDEKTSQYWFSVIHPLVEQLQEMDPFLEHGAIFTKIDVKKNLEEYGQNLIQTIEARLSTFTKSGIVKSLQNELSAIVERQLGSGCLPEKIASKSLLGGESHRQMEQAKEINQNQELEQNVQQTVVSKKTIPFEEKPWTFNPFDKNFSLLSPQKGMPSIFSIDEKLKPLGLNGLISEDIFISENFLNTQVGAGESLFNNLQKRIADILVIEENNTIKLLILSSKEAAFFKTKIAVQKKNPSLSARNLWLMTPTGKVIQQGLLSWENFNKKELRAKAEDLLMQTLFLSGNIRGINDNRSAIASWIQATGSSTKEYRQKRLYALLEKATARSSRNRQMFIKSNEIQKMFK